MTRYLCSRRSLALSGCLAALLTGLGATPALADTTSVDTSTCSAPLVSQPFLSAHDQNYYTLAPGQSPDNFDATGWTLEKGAHVVTSALADGHSGSVLDLPSGSAALSPPMCVSSAYPSARTEVRNVVGAEGVQFYVSYGGTPTWDKPRNTGQFHGQRAGWTLSDNINLQPAGGSGWQIVRFMLVPGGRTSDFQVYNFYVDPRMRF